MIIEFRCDREQARLWMCRDSLRVNDQDIPVQIAWTTTPAPQPAGLDMLFELERIVLRKGKAGGADRVKPIPQRPRAGRPDVVIDFTSAERDPNCSAGLYLRPRFNGHAGESAALAAILAGDLPVIEIVNECDGAVLDRGHPSAEIAAGLSGGLETVMARTLAMLPPILSGAPRLVPHLPAPANGGAPRNPAPFVVRGVATSIAKEIYRLCCYAPHWHVGWRFAGTTDIWRTGELSGPAWNVLADPGNRCYADPFPVKW